MNPELTQRLKELDLKLDQIYQSVEKTRKYFLWTLIITLVLVILPLLGLLFVIPTFINNLQAVAGI